MGHAHEGRRAGGNNDVVEPARPKILVFTNRCELKIIRHLEESNRRHRPARHPSRRAWSCDDGWRGASVEISVTPNGSR